MATKKINTATVGVSDKWLYKAGGVAAYCAGLIYIASIVLYAYAGKMPTTGAAWLPFISAKSGTWSAIIALNVISDILFLLVNVALFAALRRINQWLALLGTLTACVSVVFDETVTNTNLMSLHVLSGQYASAGTDAQRAAAAAAANYGAAVLGSWLDLVFTTIIPAIPILLLSIVMLRSRFGKGLARLGIAAGIFGLLAVTGFQLGSTLSTVLTAIWAVFVGRCLCFRYAVPVPTAPTETPEAEPEEAITI